MQQLQDGQSTRVGRLRMLEDVGLAAHGYLNAESRSSILPAPCRSGAKMEG